MDVSVAILDDGVYSGVLKIPELVRQFSVVYEQSTEQNSRISHGTICASILENLAPGIRLNSVTVLDRSEKGFVDGLVSGLGWCLTHDIKLINLSLGTEHYQDFTVLEPILNELIRREAVIVSAYSNRNIPSYPAYFPGVFGVRTNNQLKKGSFSICENHWLKQTNAWTAKCVTEIRCLNGNPFSILPSNSFAVPTLTASIYKILSQNPKEKISGVQYYLQREAGTTSGKECHFNSFSWVKGRESSVPFVLVTLDCANLAIGVCEQLTREGYNVVLAGREGTIPLSLYTREGSITNELLNGLAEIYKPDLLVVITKMKSADLKLGDAWIMKDGLLVDGIIQPCCSEQETRTALLEAFAGT